MFYGLFLVIPGSEVKAGLWLLSIVLLVHTHVILIPCESGVFDGVISILSKKLHK